MPNDSMVPSTNWGQAAREFAEGQGQQAILCADCVLQMGMTAVPQYVVIVNGRSYCLDHLPRSTE